MPEAKRSTVPGKVFAGAKEKGEKMTDREIKTIKAREYRNRGGSPGYCYEINSRTGNRYRIKKVVVEYHKRLEQAKEPEDEESLI
jgi:hypothetical protein